MAYRCLICLDTIGLSKEATTHQGEASFVLVIIHLDSAASTIVFSAMCVQTQNKQGFIVEIFV